MRKLVLVVCAAAVACACTSSKGRAEEDAGSAPDADPLDAAQEPEAWEVPPGGHLGAPDGKHMAEATACETIAKALKDKAIDLGCAITLATCPDHLRKESGGVCVEWDAGSVADCVKFYATYQVCEDFGDHPCVLIWYPDTGTCPPAE